MIRYKILVNERRIIYESVAKDVVKGKYGNGAIRTSNLKKAGYDPATVQKLVNQLL